MFGNAFWFKLPHSHLNLLLSFCMAAHAGAPQVFALDDAFPLADGVLKKSKREGLLLATAPLRRHGMENHLSACTPRWMVHAEHTRSTADPLRAY